MGREKPYSAQEERIVIELTANILEECCGVFSIAPDSFVVRTVSRRILVDPSSAAEVTVIDEVPYILISDVTVNWLIRSLRELRREKIKREENGIAGYAFSLAHEMYHIRQFFQDKAYFDRTYVSEEEYEQTKGRAYFGNPGEKAARGFALKYLRKKIELLAAKLETQKPTSKSPTVEHTFLDAMQTSVDFLTAQVQERATGDTEESSPPN